jgi:outer membrane biosynthesis protein TonB
MVTAQDFSERSYSEKLLLRALIISLLIHLAMFGTWKWGKTEGWWRHFSLPAWMRLAPTLLKPVARNKPAPPPQPQPQVQQLTFVDVDPELAEVVPPKNPKFYSANNSVASNPHPKNEETPEILGRQDKVVKTTENVLLKPQPLQPSPPPKKETSPAPEPKPQPQKAYTPGDLAMAKPREKTQEKEGRADTAAGEEAQPQPQPARERPRTIAEAMARHGMLGEKSRQDGGANRYRMDSTLDAVKTSYGDYDAMFIDAVKQRWYQLAEYRSPGAGRVVVEFRMLPDGRIINLRLVQSDVPDLFSIICQQAIRDPAPYRPWPMEMRRDIPQEYRDVTFTFIYE